MRRQGLSCVLVQRLGVLLAQVRGDVEDDLLDLAREPERRLVRVAAVDDEAVVATDVHPGVAGEASRHGVLHPPTRDRLAVDEQRHLAAGRRLRRVGGEDELDVDLAGRERRAPPAWVYSSTPSIE